MLSDLIITKKYNRGPQYKIRDHGPVSTLINKFNVSGVGAGGMRKSHKDAN
jgi:hypothetical protein